MDHEAIRRRIFSQSSSTPGRSPQSSRSRRSPQSSRPRPCPDGHELEQRLNAYATTLPYQIRSSPCLVPQSTSIRSTDPQNQRYMMHLVGVRVGLDRGTWNSRYYFRGTTEIVPGVPRSTPILPGLVPGPGRIGVERGTPGTISVVPHDPVDWSSSWNYPG